MKRIISVLLISAFFFANVSTLSAVSVDGDDIQESFSFYYSFYDTIEWSYFLVARLDAYCSGGQTGKGHAITSVAYDNVMLDCDYDTGAFVTSWSYAGTFQNPENNLFPIESKRDAQAYVIEYRITDILSGDLSE